MKWVLHSLTVVLALTHTCSHTLTYSHTHTHMLTCSYSHVHSHTPMLTQSHTHAHMHMFAYSHTYIDAHTHMFTHTHTHTHRDAGAEGSTTLNVGLGGLWVVRKGLLRFEHHRQELSVNWTTSACLSFNLFLNTRSHVSHLLWNCRNCSAWRAWGLWKITSATGHVEAPRLSIYSVCLRKLDLCFNRGKPTCTFCTKII